MWTIYHNQNCSKSRAAFNLLTAKSIQFNVVNYLESPPTVDELHAIYEKLDNNLEAMIRKKDDEFLTIQSEWDRWAIEQKLNFLARNPQLLERPIVVTPTTAKIGRPDHTALLALFEE